MRCPSRFYTWPITVSYLLYINDIVHVSDLISLILYADDTNIFLANRSLSQLINIINEELKLISQWFQTNRLSLNSNKTNFIPFTSPQKKFDQNIVTDQIFYHWHCDKTSTVC